MSTPKELQKQIEHHRQKIAEISANPGHIGDEARIAAHQSEIFVAASQLAEISTRRIIRLTWFLAILTAVLLVVEIRAVFFPKDASANPQSVEANQNQKVTVPAVTNR
ncbi:MAG: hypothetical protein ACLQAH_16765 [Limisphaerales bacterium]